MIDTHHEKITCLVFPGNINICRHDYRDGLAGEVSFTKHLV
jgi:hypothetical protein